MATNFVRIIKRDDGVYINGKEVDYKIYFYLEKLLLGKIKYDQIDPYYGLIARDTIDGSPAILFPSEVLDILKLAMDEIEEIVNKVSKVIPNIFTNEQTITIKTKQLVEMNENINNLRKTKTKDKTKKKS
jgi:hypothetical protein